MEIRDSVNSFFFSIGFKLIEGDTSEYFGDYYDIYKYDNGNIYFRLISDRSILSIDVGNDNLNWYDLALVKSLLYNEKDLTCVTTIEECNLFLQKEYSNIIKLFDDRNYLATKKSLEELAKERVKQMLPNL